MKPQIMLDTSIIIDALRGNSRLADILLGENHIFYINEIVEMEVLYGAFDKQNFRQLEKALKWFDYIHITKNSAQLSVEIFRKYSLAYKIGIADALIAGICMENNLPLWTLNKRHFKFIKGLKLIDL